MYGLSRSDCSIRAVKDCLIRPFASISERLVALRSKAIVSGFKHRISEVFTSSDILRHNIVIFLSDKPIETCQIVLWITKDDHLTVPSLTTWSRSQEPHAGETCTQFVVQTTKCINQLSNWCLKICWKNSGKLFRCRKINKKQSLDHFEFDRPVNYRFV